MSVNSKSPKMAVRTNDDAPEKKPGKARQTCGVLSRQRRGGMYRPLTPRVFSPLIGHSNNPNRKLWKFAALKADWVGGGSIPEAKRLLPGVVMRSVP
jgi:hypothetical protein